MKKIRIAQWGVCHEHASGKIEAARRLTDVFEVVGVVDDRDSKTPRQHDEVNMEPYEGLPWMTEDELLGAKDIDAIFVEPTNDDVPAAALKVAEAGFHMHMDKPGGQGMEPFRTIVETCREKNLVLQMGYMYRTNAALMLCRKAIDEGWMGKVIEIDMSMNRFDCDRYREYLSSFQGGAMYNLGGHLLDFVVTVLGRPQNVTPLIQESRGDGVGDNTLAVLEYGEGAHACVHLAFCDPSSFAHRRVTVRGTKGTFELCPTEPHPLSDPLKVQFSFAEDNPEFKEGENDIELAPIMHRYDEQLIEFAKCVRGEIENPYPYEHEMLVQEVLLAASGIQSWE